MNHRLLHILLLIVVSSFYSTFSAQVFKGDKYSPEEVVHDRFGIDMYEKLNLRLKGDSVRKCAGYACKGWVKDFYTTGAILHEGFYVDGQLQRYKNYYLTGQLEREFKIIDDIKSIRHVYYLNGKIKSTVHFNKKFVRKWEDFFQNGSPEFYEEYNKKIDYLIEKRYYHPNGKLRSSLKLIKKGKKIYEKKEYYDNGALESKGFVVYNTDVLDYQNTGTWIYYDQKGNEKERKDF